jgi:Zn-dependent peptidase ImmA (M78 family)
MKLNVRYIALNNSFVRSIEAKQKKNKFNKVSSMTTKLDSLFGLAFKQQIDIEYVSFPSNILGLYYKENGLPSAIGINKSILSNTKLLTCVLAEELGHHFTTIGDTTAEYYSYSDRLMVNKKETLALKWATEFLLPLNEIISIMKNLPSSLYEMADHLGVTEEFLLKRLEFLSRYHKYLQLDDQRAVVLTNLPSIIFAQSL